VLITKADLAPYMDDFDAARAQRYLRELANAAPLYSLSARTRAGLQPWLDWLRVELASVHASASLHEEAHPHDHRKAVAR
jgi:hydrogenase nickel incorporation protein HypB